MEYAIRTHSLTKKYKGVPVVDNLDINIKKGEIYGFLETKWCRENYNLENDYGTDKNFKR